MGAVPDQEASGAEDKVSWGPSTYAGYGVAAVSFVLALIAFIEGDRSEQVIGVLVPGVIGGLSFAITQVGRYLQANSKIKAQRLATAVGQITPEQALETLERYAGVVDRLRQPGGLLSGPQDPLSRSEWGGAASPVPHAATAAVTAPGGPQQ